MNHYQKNLGYLAINCFQKFNPNDFIKLEKFWPGMQGILTASISEITKLGISYNIAQEFIYWRRDWSGQKLTIELEQKNIYLIGWQDNSYPTWLKEIPSPPPLIYYQGSPPPPAIMNLAVVGSRKANLYGQLVTKKLLTEVIKSKFNIISGLAIGIDTFAHQAALENKGKTWAILGTGLDIVYPKENKGLAKKIISQGGGLISEFPLRTPPCQKNFPRRNRIISGLSIAVLVIEATHRSGSLITARHALEQGREVMAVPGEIFSPLSTGTNKLIALGASAIYDTNSLLEILNDLKSKQATKK